MKLATPCLCLIAYISFLKPCNGKAIKSFHLNKEFDILNPICDSCPDPECVIYKDESASIPFPREMTACFRTQPMSYITSWRYSTSMSFGTLLPDFSSMDEGFFYGIWDTGPWLALKAYWRQSGAAIQVTVCGPNRSRFGCVIVPLWYCCYFY